MPQATRLPAGDLILDTRGDAPSEIADLSAIFAVGDLLSDHPTAGLRVWVLHDAAARWADSGAQLLRGLMAMVHAVSGVPGGRDVVVLPPSAQRCDALVAALQSLGLSVHPTRRGGGLPVDTLPVDGGKVTALTTRPLPVRPEAQAPRLLQLVAGFDQDDDGRLEAAAVALLSDIIAG